MSGEWKGLLEVLEEVERGNPGIKLWELEPAPTGPFVRNGRHGASARRAFWDVRALRAAVEEDYLGMDPEGRQAFEGHRYRWERLPDGRVAITVTPPQGGEWSQFVQA
jgi:hypothetical protein